MKKEIIAFLRAFVLIPTWVIAQTTRPFLPQNHIWKAKMPGLQSWIDGATPLCVQFGVVFTMFSLAVASIVVVKLF